jgi:hypothetical protein
VCVWARARVCLCVCVCVCVCACVRFFFQMCCGARATLPTAQGRSSLCRPFDAVDHRALPSRAPRGRCWAEPNTRAFRQSSRCRHAGHRDACWWAVADWTGLAAVRGPTRSGLGADHCFSSAGSNDVTQAAGRRCLSHRTQHALFILSVKVLQARDATVVSKTCVC